MKRLLFVLIPLLLVGGGIYGMMRFGIPPFKSSKAKSKNAKNAKGAKSETAAKPAAATEPPVKIVDTKPTPPARVTPKRPAANTTTIDPREETRLARLTQVYEQMPVEDAARIMGKLPDPLVEKLLRRMDERQTGKILLAFDVNRAAKLTLALAR